MSRIYRALEKAESRKGQNAEEDSILRIFGEKNLPPAQEPVSKSLEGRIKKVEFPAGNGSPLIIPPPIPILPSNFAS